MIIFGRCPVTGRNGGDGTTQGNGYPLVTFRSQPMHWLTREEEIDEETDIREEEKHSDTTSFLRSIGINKA